MEQISKPDAAAIRHARSQNPKLRERDLATQLGVSEGEFLAAWCGRSVQRLKVDMDAIFGGLETVGEVMALTRNESAVHEKIGTYTDYYGGKHASMMLGSEIDTRMFPKHFVHGFAVAKDTENGTKHSLQFFDASGTATHKIHTRNATDLTQWQKLTENLLHEDQSTEFQCDTIAEPDIHPHPHTVAQELRQRWEKMTDTHQFVMILKKLGLSRHQAVSMIGDDFAWPLYADGVAAMMRHAANDALPIMCFVGSRGCIQIHSGPVKNIKPMGPWINIMDPTFHLHLRTDHIAEAWAVRKPTDKGHVTSIEAYDRQGNLIIQFFGKRIEGQDERESWRFIIENLPRATNMYAA
ncbi:MAG: ChuX/HutX family heme-like substrate-binding protein [Pseudomonadota bacterium]